MDYKEPDHLYSSCDWDMLGTCEDCLTDHPGNWWVLLDDLVTTCCVPSPFDVKHTRSMDVNSTVDCPENKLVTGKLPYTLGVLGLAAGAWAVYTFGKWIHKRFFKKVPQEVVAAGWIEMGDLRGAGGDGQFDPNDAELFEPEDGGEQGDEWDSVDLGYEGDGEASSPPLSEGLNMMEYDESEGEMNPEGVAEAGEDIFNMEI